MRYRNKQINSASAKYLFAEGRDMAEAYINLPPNASELQISIKPLQSYWDDLEAMARALNIEMPIRGEDIFASALRDSLDSKIEAAKARRGFNPIPLSVDAWWEIWEDALRDFRKDNAHIRVRLIEKDIVYQDRKPIREVEGRIV